MMFGTAPRFWHRRGLMAALLYPFSFIWLLMTWLRRVFASPFRADMPVICIGNITSGGTGKTPLVAGLADAARERGWQPVILTRGHGGSATGPFPVEPDTAAAIAGDEAVMLRRICPVVVSRDRAAGAKFISAEGLGDLIIMDDGMQNPGLIMDRLVMVFNGRSGLANGLIIPAGPLREPLRAGLERADAVAITGADETGLSRRISLIDTAIHVAEIERMLNPDDVKAVAGKPVLAFAGIGDNEGFFDMLSAAGAELVEARGFADHHVYVDEDIAVLTAAAAAQHAVLVTTEKDKARLGTAAAGVIAVRLVTRLPISLLDRILPRR